MNKTELKLEQEKVAIEREKLKLDKTQQGWDRFHILFGIVILGCVGLFFTWQSNQHTIAKDERDFLAAHLDVFQLEDATERLKQLELLSKIHQGPSKTIANAITDARAERVVQEQEREAARALQQAETEEKAAQEAKKKEAAAKRAEAQRKAEAAAKAAKKKASETKKTFDTIRRAVTGGLLK